MVAPIKIHVRGFYIKLFHIHSLDSNKFTLENWGNPAYSYKCMNYTTSLKIYKYIFEIIGTDIKIWPVEFHCVFFSQHELISLIISIRCYI